MNKLFTKIATAFVGIAMAVGVGVAVGNNTNFVKAEATPVIDVINNAMTSSALDTAGATTNGWGDITASGSSGASYTIH